MAILTAKELKDREVGEFPISIGNGQEVIVRRPDLQLLVLRGLLPVPMFSHVVRLVNDWAGSTAVSSIPDSVVQGSDELLTFVDTFVAAACVSPRVVLRPEDVQDDNTLLASDLLVETKKLIIFGVTKRVQAATREVTAIATEFPDGEPRAGSGPDVPEVLPAAV